jgi:hypothetical protein
MNFHSPQSATSTRLVYTFKHIKLFTTFLDSLFDGPTYTTRSSSFWPAQSLEPNDKHQHAFQPRWSGLVVIDPVAAGPQWQGGSDSWVPLGRIYELSDPMVQRLLVQCRCWSSAGAGPVAAGPQWQGESDSWVPLGRIHELSDPMVQRLLVQCRCWSSAGAGPVAAGPVAAVPVIPNMATHNINKGNDAPSLATSALRWKVFRIVL